MGVGVLGVGMWGGVRGGEWLRKRDEMGSGFFEVFGVCITFLTTSNQTLRLFS